MTVLTKANRQWAIRPADERFASLQAMFDAANDCAVSAAVAKIKADALRVVAVDDAVKVVGTEGRQADFTNWSFGQLASRVGAPAGYLASLPAPLAAECLNTGLAGLQLQNSVAADGESSAHDSKALFDRRNGLTLRALTSDRYSRIWDVDVIRRLMALESAGPWQPAPAAFDGSRGLYRGDRDMFAFLVDSERRIFEQAPGGGLSRGFFTWNSEVGAAAFGIASFLYEYVCGNHRVWGVQGLTEFRVVHIGKGADGKAWNALACELTRYAESSAGDDEARIASAKRFTLGATKDEVLDTVFAIRSPLLTRKTIGAAYDRAEEHADWYGSPRSAWGLAGGLTELGRDAVNADTRRAIDTAAGKIMQMAF
jgi:hypothetical protein